MYLIVLFVFPLGRRDVSLRSILRSSPFVFDVVGIKGKISPASYNVLIPLSIYLSGSLSHIFQRQMGI